MKTKQPIELTQLLRAWSKGEDAAEQAVIPLIYPELERRAKVALRRSVYQGGTIQTHGLVHEAFLKLSDSGFDITDQLHFYATSSTILRNILIDYFRSKHSVKRGGNAKHVTLSDADNQYTANNVEQLLELDDLLDMLKHVYPRKARWCEMHYFGGLTIAELADLEGVSMATVNKDLRFARAWMRAQANNDLDL